VFSTPSKVGDGGQQKKRRKTTKEEKKKTEEMMYVGRGLVQVGAKKI
jgi:hypothetical protein